MRVCSNSLTNSLTSWPAVVGVCVAVGASSLVPLLPGYHATSHQLFLTRVLRADDPVVRLRAEPFLSGAAVDSRAGRRPRARAFPRLMRLADHDALGRARGWLGAHAGELRRRAGEARQREHESDARVG